MECVGNSRHDDIITTTIILSFSIAIGMYGSIMIVLILILRGWWFNFGGLKN